MSLSAVAVRRPVFTVMVALAILILGAVGLRRLGMDLFPDVSFPAVAVTVPYPGASPAEVESLVVKPIEDAVIGIGGLDRVRSFAREGSALVVVMFNLGVDVKDAAGEVRERLSQVRYRLPEETKEPLIARFDPAAAPVLTYTLRGPISLSELRDYADDTLRPALEQVDGVAAVSIEGGAEREVLVHLDRGRLDAQGLTVGQISARLRAENLNVPAGRFEQGAREVGVRTVGEFQDVDQVRGVIVSTAPDGSVVRLRDVADVALGFGEVRTRARVNGQEAVTFSVQKQSGKNTVAVSQGVKAKLAELERTFPTAMAVELIVDQAEFIQENVDQVEHDLVYGGVMAVLVILLFMMDLRSTLISAVALPTSVVGTFFVMYVLGYTLNMMTLLALSLSIGLLIDDAVVVRENIFKHLELGKAPLQAALDGTQEVALSVLATTLTIVAVFMPVAFVEGMVGQFFRQFGVTISVAVMLSLFVAFTLDPMLSARFSSGPVHSRRFAWLKRPVEWALDVTLATYAALLAWAVKRRLWVGALALGSLAFMVYVTQLMGSEFVAAEDRAQFVLEAELPAGTSLEATATQAERVEASLLGHPEVRVVFATLGVDTEPNKVRWRIITTKKQTRSLPLVAIKQHAREAAAQLPPGTRVSVTDPAFVEGAATEAPIMINVRGQDLAAIGGVARQIEQILRATPGVTDIQVRDSPGRPEIAVVLDRQRAADRGLSLSEVALALRAALQGDESGHLRQGGDEIPIRVRLGERYRQDEQQLAQLSLMTTKGRVALADVASFVRGDGPQVIERENRDRQITVWATPLGRPLGDVASEFQPQIAALALPAGMSVAYDGDLRMMSETNTNMALALLLGVVFIYIVLASQFESFLHPLTIMLTLPLALVGGVLALFLTGNTMAMGAMIGIVLLMGLVSKNAILLIDRAIVRVRDHGESPEQAVLAAGPERLRPILMTSAAMVLGMWPTAVSDADGSEFRAPMAIAVIGGVISSTLLSLIVVPVFYLTAEGLKARVRRGLALLRGGRTSAGAAPGE